MDAIGMVAIVVLALALLGMAANLVGADSRDGMDDSNLHVAPIA